MRYGCVNVLFSDQVRWQEAHHSFVSAVQDHATFQHVLHNGLGGIGGVELHANHQTQATHLLNPLMLLLQSLQLLEQVISRLLNVLKQLLPLQNIEQLQRDGAGEWASTEGCAVHSRMNALRNFFAGQKRAQWQAASDWFGDGHQVRLDTVMLVGKPASGTSQPALDFICNQQRIVFLRQPMRRLRELCAHGADSPFSLYKLKADGANGVIKIELQIGNVIKFHKLHSGQNRRKWHPVFFLVCGGQRAKSASVKSMLQG